MNSNVEDNNTTKLTTEELSTLSEIQRVDKEISIEFGNLKREQIDLDNRLEFALEILKKFEKDKSDFLQKLNEKYGKGSVNLDTGLFTSLVE